MGVIYSLDHVSYSYLKSVSALANINLSVSKGEKLIVLGANGCGKSTLLKLLNGLIFPTGGVIQAFGQVLNESNLNANPYEFRKKVGFVFQDSDTQLFCSSVFDEIAFAPLQMGLTLDNSIKRVHATLKDFDIEELKERPPYRLSGGEKKKVALAAVTVYNPEVLLLDEPTNSLDPRTKKWFLTRLDELNRNGTTIVIAVHDLGMAKNFADRVIVMNEQHTIETIGKSEEIFADDQLLLDVNLI
ncbi:MAG TPA: nickel ABC transporter ATP-binding protein [Firmicutes bacterium]|jgi:cobalt/nickel transport system ATP-binding protein|nr:nickel ABC transporter ATP-binding protein [Bacillota bacterium]